MTALELKLNLPDRLARDAKAAGLLTEQELERLVRCRCWTTPWSCAI
jgi:hypothetical protein